MSLAPAKCFGSNEPFALVVQGRWRKARSTIQNSTDLCGLKFVIVLGLRNLALEAVVDSAGTKYGSYQ